MGVSEKIDRCSVTGVLFGVVAWLCAAGGALSVADIPGEYGSSMCGAWGCYPPLQALLAMHLFWCVVMVPVVWTCARFRPHWLRRIGLMLAASATLAAVVVVGWDVIRWVQRAEEFRQWWPNRAIYTLLNASDVPLMQTFLAGIVCIVLGCKPNPGVNGNRPGDRHTDAECHA